MFVSRKITSNATWLDCDGIKIYTISADGSPVDQQEFIARLSSVKKSRNIPWFETPAFVIFHEGEESCYLVLCWWGNSNELFNSVSVLTQAGWVEDAGKYSFCLYDLEVFWSERNIFIETMYGGETDIEVYRSQRGVYG